MGFVQKFEVWKIKTDDRNALNEDEIKEENKEENNSKKGKTFDWRKKRFE